MSSVSKVSDVEVTKLDSHQLRGTIGKDLSDAGVDHFTKEDANLLKHHGTYQQDDRDARAASKGAGAGAKAAKQYIFMVRTKIPGGIVTSKQLLAELDLCDALGNGTLRATTRQGFQHHGVLKDNLQEVIARINECGLSTLGACGDVNRNVMCCPAPHRNDPVHREMQQTAATLADHFAPKTKAYREIWLRDDQTNETTCAWKQNGSANGHEAEDIEPIYGKVYLPRKFKMAIGLPGDNCVDMYTNDLAFMAICHEFQIIGYNVLAGGGQGVTPSAKKTFPALAKRLCFVTPDQVIAVAEAIVKVQRDFGNRADRKVARMKYLINDWGLEKFKAKVEEYFGAPLPEPHPDDVWGFDDHLGWHDQGDGKIFYGLNIENGRIKDVGDFRLKTALRAICAQFEPAIHVTSHQSILLCDLPSSSREPIEALLRAHGVPLSEEISTARRWSMACVGWPTCGLTIAESERALPGIIDQVEVELARLGLSKEAFTIRMTGCPNGCARPYNCDVGIVGQTLGKYRLLLGGRLLGDRLNWEYKDMVPEAEVAPTLAPVFAMFKTLRDSGESFGDFCQRKGKEEIQAWVEQHAAAVL